MRRNGDCKPHRSDNAPECKTGYKPSKSLHMTPYLVDWMRNQHDIDPSFYGRSDHVYERFRVLPDPFHAKVVRNGHAIVI